MYSENRFNKIFWEFLYVGFFIYQWYRIFSDWRKIWQVKESKDITPFNPDLKGNIMEYYLDMSVACDENFNPLLLGLQIVKRLS